jgi:hypothetical protein
VSPLVKQCIKQPEVDQGVLFCIQSLNELHIGFNLHVSD